MDSIDLHLPVLELIAETTGLDSEEVVDYVEEDDNCETVLPIDLNSTLLLNNIYIESVDELKQYLLAKRRENESRQSELHNNTTYKTVRDVTINHYGYSHPNSLIPFMAPYFKDVKGLTAPFNCDTIEKRNNEEINESYVCSNKPWNVTDRQRLLDILLTDSVERQHKPLRDEKERLTKDKKNIAKHIQRINEITEQIEKIGEQEISESTAPDRWHSNLDWLKFATELDTDHTAEDCELYWNNFLHPTINKSQWTREEDRRLEQLVKQHGMHAWDAVAKDLDTGRLSWQCCQRYQSELNRDIKRVGPLTKQEAETVEKVIESCRVGDFIPWHQIKYFIEGRTLPQIKHYWNKINCPKRGDVWIEEENKVLAAAVKKYGTHNWRKVAQFIPGRSNRQCRERYMMRMNFGTDRKLGNWTAQEDKLILQLAPELNFHWVKLEAQIKGRNARQIAGRYELLMKYKSKGKDVRKTKNKFGNKSSFATRTLTVRNRLYDRIRQMINRNNNQMEDLDRILRNGRAKLAKRLELELKGITVSSNKGRPKKTAKEENIDSKIVEMFASFDFKNSPKKAFSRSAQDQCVYDTTKHIISEQLTAKKFNSNTELVKAIRLFIGNSVTKTWNESLIDDSDEESDNSGHNEWTPPPIYPPNRTTVRALRTLLIQIDVFTKMIAKSKIPLEKLSSALKMDQNYVKLLAHFKSLFCWPALLSLVEPPEREPVVKPVANSTKSLRSKQRKSWLKTESSRMVDIRRHQTELIQTEMLRNAETKIEAPEELDEQPLDEKSSAVPWYVTQKDRKYYSLKSLDKNSFVFTRVKPKYDSIKSPETEDLPKSDKTLKNKKRKNKSNEESITKVTKNKDLDYEPKPALKKKRISLKMALNDENVDEQRSEDLSEPTVTPILTRRLTRSSTASSQCDL